MTVLVTGGLGVNGVWVVRRLLEDGQRTIVLDVRDDTSLLPPEVAAGLDLRIGDVTDRTAITELVRREGVGTIVHLAALLPERCERDPAAADQVNVGGTLAVLEAARQAGVDRVVYASSRAVYGQLLGEHGYPTYAPVGEDAPRVSVPPMRIYGASKVFCEELGWQYATLYGFEFAALRFASIIGIGKEARHGALPIQGRMIENALKGEPTVIERGGEERDDMMYVKDMARAVSLTCSAPRVARAYNIGSGTASSLRDLADAVRTVAPAAEISIGPGRDYLGCGPLYGLLDISRARADLGYEPEYDLASTVADYVRDLGALGGQTPSPP